MSVTLAEVNETLKEQKPLLEKAANGLDVIARIAEDQQRRSGAAEENRRERLQRGSTTNNISGIGGILASPGIGLGATLEGAGGLLSGIGGAGAGIGAFFMGLAGAEAIMTKFGNGDNLKALLTNLAEGLGAFGGPELIALGGLFAGAALFGSIGGIGESFQGGFGIAAIGAGIAAFFTSFSIADNLISKYGSNGSNIPIIAKNIADAIRVFVQDGKVGGSFAGLLATGAIFGALAGETKRGAAALGGMSVGTFAIGAALGSFFAGFAAIDAGAQWLSGDGSRLKTIAQNVYDTIAIFKDSSWMTGLLAGGAIFGAVAGAAVSTGVGAGLAAGALAGAPVGTFVIGAALGAFFAGFAAVDAATEWLGKDADGSTLKKIATNLADSIRGFENIDSTKVFSVGGALTSLGKGMLSFFGAEGLHGIQNLWGNLKEGFYDIVNTLFGTNFGEGKKKSAIEYIVDSLKPIDTVSGEQLARIDEFSIAIKGLSSSFQELANIRADGITTSLSGMLRGIGALLDAKEALMNGGTWSGQALGFGDNISFGPEGSGGLKNLSDDQLDTIKSGVSKLYSAMGVSLPATNIKPASPISVPADLVDTISGSLKDLYAETIYVKQGINTPSINYVDASSKVGPTSITTQGSSKAAAKTAPPARGSDFNFYGGPR